jgi:PAS domain S-box-containing protein
LKPFHQCSKEFSDTTTHNNRVQPVETKQPAATAKPMPNPLHVLMVDDSEDDTMLIARALEREHFKLSYKRVENADDLGHALEERAWDLILSDYSMPKFTGAEALAVCQKKAFDAPFIIVSGRIGEEVAVDMMKAGASDYVMKDDLPRLAPAVNRELRAARERQIRRQAQLAMAHLAAIVESCDDAIISQTLGGTVLSWNSGAEHMFGYAAEDMVGESIEILIPHDQHNEISDIRDLIQLGERVEHLETVRVRRDGRQIDVSITISPITNADRNIHGASIVLRDITERKRQEKERLHLIEELTEALKRVKTLNGLLPICASCKKIRNDGGYWEQVESYIKSRSNAEFTHGICPDCVRTLYPEYQSILLRGTQTQAQE